MSITIINNQPIRFQNESEITNECRCLGQEFCQLVNKNDNTQFQISSDNDIVNGGFDTDLDGWEVYEGIGLAAEITNESAEDECDGEVVITATGGAGGYTYSIDGGAFGGSNTFSNLCAGTYIITVKDSEDNEGSISVTIYTNVSCGDYEGATIQDLVDAGITLGELYNCTLDDLQL